jgi:polyisoprenoid-binding protein YceI
MSVQPGSYRLGPDDATLSVHTGRSGAAAKAGHDLVMHATVWAGTLVLAEDPAKTTVELSVAATSLRVQKGTGGMQALGDDDKDNIHQTIDDEVLERQDIVFRSRAVSGDAGGPLKVEGDLTLAGTTNPVAFDLTLGDDGTLAATARLAQTDWGMKPYSALFGALKVADEVDVVLEGHLKA